MHSASRTQDVIFPESPGTSQDLTTWELLVEEPDLRASVNMSMASDAWRESLHGRRLLEFFTAWHKATTSLPCLRVTWRGWARYSSSPRVQGKRLLRRLLWRLATRRALRKHQAVWGLWQALVARQRRKRRMLRTHSQRVDTARVKAAFAAWIDSKLKLLRGAGDVALGETTIASFAAPGNTGSRVLKPRPRSMPIPSCPPCSPTRPTRNPALENLQRMLTRFYQKISPGAHPAPRTVAQMYATDIAALNAALLKKYGASLQELAPSDEEEDSEEAETAQTPSAAHLEACRRNLFLPEATEGAPVDVAGAPECVKREYFERGPLGARQALHLAAAAAPAAPGPVKTAAAVREDQIYLLCVSGLDRSPEPQIPAPRHAAALPPAQSAPAREAAAAAAETVAVSPPRHYAPVPAAPGTDAAASELGAASRAAWCLTWSCPPEPALPAPRLPAPLGAGCAQRSLSPRPRPPAIHLHRLPQPQQQQQQQPEISMTQASAPEPRHPPPARPIPCPPSRRAPSLPSRWVAAAAASGGFPAFLGGKWGEGKGCVVPFVVVAAAAAAAAVAATAAAAVALVEVVLVAPMAELALVLVTALLIDCRIHGTRTHKPHQLHSDCK